MFENTVYDGIPALLADLKASGYSLIVATSKPEPFAVRILEHFDLARYFDRICGASLDEKRSTKSDVIAYTLATCGIDPTDAIMIGDRHHDVNGAHENGIPAIAVLYGYGDRAEHEAAGAEHIVESVADLRSLLLRSTP
jgi:phosphoglycolate phosphatase